MAWYEVEFDPEGPQDLTIVGHGVSHAGDWNAFVAELMRDRRFRPNMKILGDFTRVASDEMPMSGVVDIGKNMASLEELWGDTAFAAVVSDKLTFGFVRGAMLAGNLSRVEVFPTYSLAEALAWLEARAAPADA